MPKTNQVSLINSSRDNLKYLKWSYESVRKNAPNDIEYCVASDYSSDGTVEWCEETAKKDKYFKFIVNDGTWFGKNKGEPKRMGITLLHDKLIEEVSTREIFIIWHSDMYLAPGSIENVLNTIKPKTVVSMTRIEPPLHIPGFEKIISDFGTEPENFQEKNFIKFVERTRSNVKTEGMFAPWAIYKKDFLDIGGHDPLFVPQSREDSDIFNRFLLAGYKPIQLWNSFVYHLTCRGSRFNPKLTRIGLSSNEWLEFNKKSERNFIRKWGHMVKVDENLKPIIPHKYKISFVVQNCDTNIINALEPWCTYLYCNNRSAVEEYINIEQKNTMYDLSKRVFPFIPEDLEGDVIVYFDAKQLTQKNFHEFITQLSSILDHTEEPGNYEYDIFDLQIKQIKYYEHDLIVLDKKKTIR